MTEEQKKKCHAIIHTASVSAGAVGGGLPIPLADNAVITPIQITMITSLGAVFNIRVTEGLAKGIIAGTATSMVGRNVVKTLTSWIPIVGNAVNTATAAGLTETIGWLAVAHFSNAQQQDQEEYRLENKKAGYEQASAEYEAKLRQQAADFLQQKKEFKLGRKEYAKLVYEYEQYIRERELEQSETGVVNPDLGMLKTDLRRLRSLQAKEEHEKAATERIAKLRRRAAVYLNEGHGQYVKLESEIKQCIQKLDKEQSETGVIYPDLSMLKMDLQRMHRKHTQNS